MIRQKSDLHAYQQQAITWIFEHDRSLALMPVGAGKTVVTMTALQELMAEGAIKRPLVFAPMRVAENVWPYEGAEWAHLGGIEIVRWGGAPENWAPSIWRQSRELWGQRSNAEARLPKIEDVVKRRVLETRLGDLVTQERRINKAARTAAPAAAIHVTSYENLLWLTDLYAPGDSPFDAWVFDEIGRLKNPKSPRYKAARKHTAGVPIVVGLNATPAPEGFEDLFAQVGVVDNGKLWGKSFYAWRQRYFTPTDYMGFSWRLQLGAKDLLLKDLNTLAFKVDETQLAYQRNMQHSQIVVDLPPAARTAYADMEKKMALEIEGKGDVVAMSMAAASMKLRQISNGFIYDEAGAVHRLHEEKVNALAELLDDMGREPLIVSYEFIEDLEAIRRIWKNVPYLGQGLGSSAARDTIDRWNRRELPVLALHRLCLHPNTLVLTEHLGWKKLIDVRTEERVFDGVEFVSHSGCQLTGVRPVIDCFGIKMTPDHRILVGNRWVKAEDVRNISDAKRTARYAYAGDDPSVRALLHLRTCADTSQAERGQKQPGRQETLSYMLAKNLPPYDRHAPLSDMARNAEPHLPPEHQKFRTLRWTWNYGRSRVAKLQEFLAGYAARLRRQPHDRAHRREWSVLQRELHLDYEHGAAGQQTNNPDGGIQKSTDAFFRILSRRGRDKRRDQILPQSVRNRGCSHGSVSEIDLPEMASQPERLQTPQKVYDLIDCGPRQRFVVRNDAGEMFVVHNSAGHGLNLQHGGSHVAWYSLPWDLEGYQQLNGRVDRQGQTRACFGHHIIARDTIDQRVSDALVSKDVSQAAIISAIRSL